MQCCEIVLYVRSPIFNCPLLWFATINRTSHLVLYQILKIQCLWWHSPNMTACIFSLYILHFVEHIYRLPFYHLLYDIDFTCHHIAVPMLWCDARGCDTATCCCDTATCYNTDSYPARQSLCHLLSILIISVKSFPNLVAHTFVYNH